MKQIKINKTIIIFLNHSETLNTNSGTIKQIQTEYSGKYDNLIIYNYFDLLFKKSLIKDKINKLKFINQDSIYARNCVIQKIISPSEKAIFLNNNHIQGNDKSQISYGAYYNNELVAIMTFDKTKGINGGLNDGEYDLSRFCVKSGKIIVGIFSKILKEFIVSNQPKRIISFADLNYVNKNKNIYSDNGFKISKHLKQDFKYYHTIKNKIYHKLTFGNRLRKKLNDQEKQELDSKLIKIWDSGKLKYELLIDNTNKIIFGSLYKITNLINHKVYIGQTTRNFQKRILEYKSAFNTNNLHNQYLLSAFNKYGFDNFSFEIIDTASSLDELNQKEIFYISKYKSNSKEFGYNIEAGGNNAIPSDETKIKMSQSHSGMTQNMNWVNKRVAKAGSNEAKKYGKKKSDEDKNHLREISPKYWQGKNRSDETKRKISETKKLQKLTPSNVKKVIAYDPTSNQELGVFDNTSLAGQHFGISQSTVSRRCSGVSKNTGNVYFKYY